MKLRTTLRAAAPLALSGAGLALAATYNSVDITLKHDLGTMTLGVNDKVSPVMGVRNPTVKNGVAYVAASQSQGDWAIGLSPKLPIALSVQTTQGDTTLNLRSLKLSALKLSHSLGGLELRLPAANLNASLNHAQGDATIILPPNTGISLEVKSFTQGTLIIGGKTVADGLDFNGTYQSANFGTAKYKVNVAVTKELGSLTVK